MQEYTGLYFPIFGLMKLLPALVFFFLYNVNAQPTQFQKLYGGKNNSIIGYELSHTRDGKIILSGMRFDNLNDAMLMKIDLNGDTVWTGYYDSGNYEVFSSIKELAGGEFIAAGSLDTVPFFAYISYNGNVQWAKTIYAEKLNVVREILPMDDSGFVAVADGYERSVVFRMSSAGALLWSTTIDQKNYYDIIELSDGNLMACGSRSAFPSQFGLSDISLMKMSPSGNILWEKVAGNNLYQSANSLIQSNNGSCYLTGQQNDPSGDSDILLLKCDTAGTIDWVKTFNGGNQDVAIEISTLSAGDIMINGHSSTLGASRGFMLKTNEAGNQSWFHLFGDTIANGCWSMLTIDSGYVTSGYTSVYEQGLFSFRALLGRTDTNGFTGCKEAMSILTEQTISYADTFFFTESPLPFALIDTNLTASGGTTQSAWCPFVGINEPANGAILVYPNPAHDAVYFHFDRLPVNFQVFNNLGQLILQEKPDSYQHKISTNSGLFTYSIEFDNGNIVTGRFIRL